MSPTKSLQRIRGLADGPRRTRGERQFRDRLEVWVRSCLKPDNSADQRQEMYRGGHVIHSSPLKTFLQKRCSLVPFLLSGLTLDWSVKTWLVTSSLPAGETGFGFYVTSWKLMETWGKPSYKWRKERNSSWSSISGLRWPFLEPSIICMPQLVGPGLWAVLAAEFPDITNGRTLPFTPH